MIAAAWVRPRVAGTLSLGHSATIPIANASSTTAAVGIHHGKIGTWCRTPLSPTGGAAPDGATVAVKLWVCVRPNHFRAPPIVAGDSTWPPGGRVTVDWGGS